MATPAPSPASSFEEVARDLKLVPGQYTSSLELRAWVARYKDEKYVPSEVLKAFGFDCEDE